MNPETLLTRTRARCAREHDGRDHCPLCFQAEMIEMLVEENSELCRDDAMNVVSEWILKAGKRAH